MAFDLNKPLAVNILGTVVPVTLRTLVAPTRFGGVLVGDYYVAATDTKVMGLWHASTGNPLKAAVDARHMCSFPLFNPVETTSFFINVAKHNDGRIDTGLTHDTISVPQESSTPSNSSSTTTASSSTLRSTQSMGNATIIPINRRSPTSAFRAIFSQSGARVIAHHHSPTEIKFACVSISSEHIVAEILIRPFHLHHELIAQNEPPTIGDVIYDVIIAPDNSDIDIVGINSAYVTSTLDTDEPPKLTVSVTRLTERSFTLISRQPPATAAAFAHLPELAIKRVLGVHPTFKPIMIFEGAPLDLDYDVFDTVFPEDAAFAPLHSSTHGA